MLAVVRARGRGARARRRAARSHAARAARRAGRAEGLREGIGVDSLKCPPVYCTPKYGMSEAGAL